MTRGIKFRAWDKKRKRFGYFLLSRFGIDIPIESYLPLNLHRSEDDEIYRIEYEDIEWLQYTGLIDKNGVEIYEGDILGYVYDGSVFNWLIGFSDGGFILQNIGVNGYLMDAHNLKQSSCLDRIVIGNIYENAELLKQS